MKLQPWIVSILSILIAWIFFQHLDIETYRAHHEISTPLKTESTFFTSGELHFSPDSEDWLVQKIDATNMRAYVAVYMFTLPSLREALLRAKVRGADVRVIVEKNPYLQTTINRETLQFFEKNGISVHQSGENQFTFMHAKFMVFDDNWTIATANWTRSSFSSNREFFISGKDEQILSQLVALFQTDFKNETGKVTHTDLLAGPTNARERLTEFLSHTEKSIQIYAPSFTDALLLQTLAQLCYQKKSVQILLSSTQNEEYTPDYGPCIEVKTMKKPLHAKVIIRDDEAFVGSFNFTKNSLENNREVGIFLGGEVVEGLKKFFSRDWSAGNLFSPAK